MSNKKGIEKHCEYLKSKIRKKQLKIDELREKNEQLKEEIKDLEFIVGLRQRRNLISKFNKEFDEEDKKKNPSRDYAVITPDAEEVYKRYYELKNKEDYIIKYLEKHIKMSKTDDTVTNGMHFISSNHAIYKDVLKMMKEE